MPHKLSKASIFGGLFIFFIIFLLNHFMPYHRDDYNYSLIWNTTIHLETFSDVFQSLKIHYMEHGGRMVAFSILDSFLLYPKYIFNIANAFVYTLVIFLIVWHSLSKITFTISPYRLGLAFIFSWLCFPHYGEVAIWMCGATVYLWSAMFLLIFLLPYHIRWSTYLGNSNFKKENSTEGTLSKFGTSLGQFVLGFLAGCSVENAAVISVTLVFLASWHAKKHAYLSSWHIAGAIGNLLGFIFLVAAPGNFVRTVEQDGGIFQRIGNQFAGNGEMLLYVIPLLLSATIVYRILKEHDFVATEQCNDTKKNKSGIYFTTLLAIVLGISYMTDGIIGKTLGDSVVAGIITPLGRAGDHKLLDHIYNLTMGIEEMGLYLILLYVSYNGIVKLISLKRISLSAKERKTYLVLLIQSNPIIKSSIILVAFALYGNFAMIAAPTFPVRATFFSVIILIIATLSLGNIRIVQERLEKYKARIAGILLLFIIPFYCGTLYFSQEIYKYDAGQVAAIQLFAQSNSGKITLYHLPIKQRMQRHIFYSDFDNGVTQGGISQYYGIKGIDLK